MAGADGGGEVPQANGLVIHGGDAFAAVHDDHSVGSGLDSSADDGGLTAYGTSEDGDPGEAAEGEKRGEGEGGDGALHGPPGGGAENLDVGGETEEKAERSGLVRLFRFRAADAGETQEAACGGKLDLFAGQSQFGVEGGAAGGEEEILFLPEEGAGGEHAVDGDERGVAAMGQSGDGAEETRGRRGSGTEDPHDGILKNDA